MPFLQSVTSDLVRRAGLSDLHNYTLVFPMQRAGLFVKQYIAQELKKSNQPVLLPHLTTIDELVDSLSGLHGDEELLSICRLHQIYQSVVVSDLPLDVFYGWGKQLLSDFSNADMSLHDVRKLFRHTSDAATLDALTLDSEVKDRLMSILGEQGRPGSVRQHFQQLWENLPAVYEQFSQQQQTDGLGTRGARYRWVIEHFDELQPRVAERKYVFVGFNYLLSAERRVMELLKNHAAETLFYWDYDPTFPLQTNICKFIRQNIEKFGQSLPEEHTPQIINQNLSTLSCQSNLAQAQYVHDWLLQNHSQGQRTAVVLADESMLESVIYALPEVDDQSPLRHINVTKGYPLRNTRIYSEVQKIQENLKTTASGNPDELLQTLALQLEQVYRKLDRSSHDSWQQILADEAYYQTQASVRRLRTLLLDHPELHTQLSAKALLSILNSQLSTLSIPFHGEPVTDVQIIGVLETRLLDFDNVLILNIEEGVVPNTAVDHSFIPYDLRKSYGMQTRDEEATIYGYNFFRLLRRAQVATMTFSEASEDMGKKSMSRFLMQMLASPAYAVQRFRLTESAERTEFVLGNTSMQPGQQMPNRLSPSAYGDFIECPRQFYLKHVCHIYEPEDTSVLFLPSTLGTLVHGTLEHYYRDHCDLSEALTLSYEDANQDYLRHHRQAKQGPYRREEHEAENFVILRMAENVLKHDSETPGLAIEALELECHYPLPLFMPGLPETIDVKGFVDRLDSVSVNGHRVYRVVDYKTGKFDAAKFKIKSLDDLFTDPKMRYALQTLIYCQMVSALKPLGKQTSPIFPELFYPRSISSDGRLQFDGLPLTDFEQQIGTDFQERLRQKTVEILQTTEFSPADEKLCTEHLTYCPFHLLCARKTKTGW